MAASQFECRASTSLGHFRRHILYSFHRKISTAAGLITPYAAPSAFLKTPCVLDGRKAEIRVDPM